MVKVILYVMLVLTCVPICTSEAREADSVIMIAGQSREEFSSYITNVCVFGKECGLPAGAAFYTSLDAQGIDSPHANVSGDNHQDMWFLTHVYDSLEIQIGLWLGTDQLEGIGKGMFNRKIDNLARKLGGLKRPVYLRIGYEFDGPHNRYRPDDYIRAYRVIADRMRQENNVILVWHSYAMNPTYQERGILEWYPGDEYVDWIGISFFQVTEEGYHKSPNRARVIEVARETGKPVMIGEASAIRYTQRQKQQTGLDYWNYWYKPFFDFIEANDEIRAVSIINVNWDSQKQHAVLEWGDSRIESDKQVLSRWREKMKKDYWLFSKKEIN